jgi:hypothetical protein
MVRNKWSVHLSRRLRRNRGRRLRRMRGSSQRRVRVCGYNARVRVRHAGFLRVYGTGKHAGRSTGGNPGEFADRGGISGWYRHTHSSPWGNLLRAKTLRRRKAKTSIERVCSSLAQSQSRSPQFPVGGNPGQGIEAGNKRKGSPVLGRLSPSRSCDTSETDEEPLNTDWRGQQHGLALKE